MKKKLNYLMKIIISLSLLPIFSISFFESGIVIQKDSSIICTDINDCLSHFFLIKILSNVFLEK